MTQSANASRSPGLMESATAITQRLDLLKYLVVSKLKAKQRDFILGYVWWILDPLLLMLIYWGLISVIFGRGGPDYPIFILCAIVPWRAAAMSFGQSVSSIAGKQSIITQINFPRIFLPMSDVLVNQFKLIFGFVVIAFSALLWGVDLGFNLILLIVPFTLQMLLSIGIAFVMSIVGVFVRDLQSMIQFIMRALLYASPVLYSIEQAPAKYRALLLLNPFAPLLAQYRNIILYGQGLDIHLTLISVCQSLITLLTGYVIFVYYDRRILKLL